MDFSQGGLAIQVKDEYCDPIEQPDDISACHVSCPGNCVVSPWSAWSDCDKVIICRCHSSNAGERILTHTSAPNEVIGTITPLGMRKKCADQP